jgi:hypothetical protein
VGEVTAAMRQHDLQLRVALDHTVEDEMARGHGGFERIADHVVEVMVEQALALREADRMHEEDDAEVFRFGEEGLEVQPAIGKIHAVHARVDLDSAQIELLHAMLELRYCEA